MRTPRPYAVVLGFALVAALSSPAEAEAPVHPVLVTGRILDGTGQPVAGPVEVRAWPTGFPLSVGDVVEPPLVTTGSADGDGEFTLRSSSSPELHRLAEVNNGYVNFVMLTPEGGQWHFSRYLGGRPANSPSPSPYSADGVRWSDRPDVAAEPLEVRTPGTLTFNSKSGRTPLMCGRYFEVVKTERAATKIGEINAEGDTVHNDFVYGEGNTADSDISVAVRGARGPWQLSGSYHVGTSRVAKVGHEGGALESMWFTSGFDYHLMRDECRREMVTVHQWRGGIENHPQINQGCTIDPYRRHAEPYESGGRFERSENRAVTWTNAAEIFGASLSSRSGFSKEVHMQLKFGSDRVHWVCGDDDVPIKSKRVFSGNSSPI